MGEPSNPGAEANAPDIVLQTEQPDGSFVCQGFTGVPAARRVWIAMVSSGSADGRGYVRQLAGEMQAVLLSSCPDAVMTPMQCPAGPSDILPDDYPDRRKVLVLVGAADRPFRDLPWYGNWESDQKDAVVMTVLPPGKFEDLFDEPIRRDAKHLLRRVNASSWKKQPSEALPGVLARADITSSSSRVFISYRRLETLPIALQLFDALTHEGFEVFLDRFSIPPGYDFQRRLMQELEDKSMVVLLESKHLRDSEWTREEIAFATKSRLGMASLLMPDVEEKESLVRGMERAHIPLQASDLKGAARSVDNPERPGEQMNEWPELQPDVLKRVVAEIKAAHAAALFNRRHRLRNDLVTALRAIGVQANPLAVGPLVVKIGSEEHLVWVTTRPPEVDDFRSVYTAHRARTGVTNASRGLIVGPQAALEPDRRQRLDWLHRVSECLSFDEGDLGKFAQRVKSGVWA
jgi:hypothetical protein